MNELANNIFNNFYKFVFVFGTAICAASFAAPEYLEFKLYERLMSAEREINRIETESSENYADAKLFKLEMTSLELRFKQAIESGNMNMLSEITSDLKSNILDLKSNNYKNIEEIKNAKVESKYLDYLNKKIKSIKTYKYIGFGFGVALIIFGLHGWYFRVQCLLDQKLKREISI